MSAIVEVAARKMSHAVERLRISRSPAPRGQRTANVVVSLTTYPARVVTVHRTIKSLLLQSVRPEAIVLYLSVAEFAGRESALPSATRQLLARFGDQFHVRWVEENTRSYKKLVPAVRDFPDIPILTADDDVIYPQGWVETLLSAHSRFPAAVVGSRGAVISFSDDRMLPYRQWPQERSQTPSDLTLLTGRGGILYPPGSLDSRVSDMGVALEMAPRADDLWFKCMSLLAGSKSLKVDMGAEFAPSGADQRVGLYRKNLLESENDPVFLSLVKHFGLWSRLYDTWQSRARAE